MSNKFYITFLVLFVGLKAVSQSQPNILWIVTDDHRADALECFNEATTGKPESALGYVSSPNLNQLADEGALFVNAFCNSPACGPSRGSMVSGRYPFRIGHYSFNPTHQAPDFTKPTFPQDLQKRGYKTALFGKDGCYIFKWGPGQGFKDAHHYDSKVSFKHDLQKHDIGDFWNQPAYLKNTWKNLGTEERIKYPDGTIERYFIKKKNGEISEEDKNLKEKIEKKYEILRAYKRYNKNLIIGGENPLPAGETIDAKIVEEFKRYLKNQNGSYNTTWGQKRSGAESNKPLMVNLGFHLPHTPVLAPKTFRDEFKKKNYTIPEFHTKDMSNYTPQMKKLYRNLNMHEMSHKDKIQAIQDYYAFCAYGDSLIGDAIASFKEYCKMNKQEYVILFTVGDHGWHLGEQGIEAKFGPWEKSTKGAMILVSSDKSKVPSGIVQNQLIEYVDIAPTILETAGADIKQESYDYLDGSSLFNFLENEKEVREYVLGEINLVAGPRAYMRSKDFAFSMRTRPQKRLTPNQDVKWALECPVEKAELALYDLRIDPNERDNVAADKKYKKLASWYRQKLGNIVLGDQRIECDWSKENTYNVSDFAKGSDDKKLKIPKKIIPKI